MNILTLVYKSLKIMSVTGFEILHDETIELLDGNNENILLRMMRIGFQNNEFVGTVLLDSKERFYMFTFSYKNIAAEISDFYYSPNSILLCNYCQIVVEVYHIKDEYDIILKKLKCFYDNRHEYWPTSGLTDFELK